MNTPNEADLITLIAEQSLTDRSKLTRDATLDTLGLDSVDIVSVAFELEDKYGITVSDNEFSKDQTLGQLLDLIEAKISDKASVA